MDNYDSDNEEISTDKNISRQPVFKLYFPPKSDVGFTQVHSRFRRKTVSPKFYTYDKSTEIDLNEIEKAESELVKEKLQSNKKYDSPITENCKYGWYLEKYKDIKGTEVNIYTDFRKHVDYMLTERLMSFVKIRP
ncbi:uncharacterized protein LOC108740358 [Agrilus planipennis]|uniref:Uncharacterized protein LOC108740358 n=1 Tax=Agrilus planipennis TaxID=224129 RepID=A0A1W4X1Z2_AGRPL|nr:uncharacterized protein LOC108740358 [Agrilus planipennis]